MNLRDVASLIRKKEYRKATQYIEKFEENINLTNSAENVREINDYVYISE